jgi:uncharacterized membrane protein YhhN
MSALTIAAIALTPTAVAALLYARKHDHERAVVVSKAIASALFLVVAFATTPADAPYGLAMRVALVLCAVGDLCLASESRRALAAGIAAFGLGHLGFCVAFVPVAQRDVALALAGPLLLIASAVVWSVRARLGALLVPVALYTALLTATGALGLAVWASAPGGPGRALVGLGTLLFFASDAFVARQRFGAPSFTNRLIGVPLYYAGQLLIAASIGLLSV